MCQMCVGSITCQSQILSIGESHFFEDQISDDLFH